MNAEFDELRSALDRRLGVVADREWYRRDPIAHLEALKEASATLDGLVTRLPKNLDPMLRHYLERQSYVKARDWLSAPVIPHE